MIADKLQINRESVRQIVIQNLGMRKTCHAPHHKSDDQRQERLEASKDFVETAKVTPNFLNCIVTKDESLCLRYGLEMKRQTMEWRSLASPPRWKKVRGFLPERTAGDECCKVHWNFDPFHETSSSVRSQYTQGSWFFVHDNAALTHPISSNRSRQKRKWCKLNIHHTRQISILQTFFYSHDSLWKESFDNISDIQWNVTKFLNQKNPIPKEDFLQNFQDMYIWP